MPINRVYEEICQPRESTTPTEFPDACPICGAPCVQSKNDGPHYDRFAQYACDGSFTRKSQAQTHTTKYWGCCKAETVPDKKSD